MRSTVIMGLVFALAGVPAVQAQQVAAPASAEQPAQQSVVVRSAPPEANLAPVPAEAAHVRLDPVESSTARQISTRNFLAIIGGVVVVLALVAFLR